MDDAEFAERVAIDEYRIDPRMLAAWVSGGSSEVTITRSDLLNLQAGIDFIIQAQIKVVNLLSATMQHRFNDAEQATIEYARSVVQASNYARRFQAGIMERATGLKLDDRGNLTGEPVHDQ